MEQERMSEFESKETERIIKAVADAMKKTAMTGGTMGEVSGAHLVALSWCLAGVCRAAETAGPVNREKFIGAVVNAIKFSWKTMDMAEQPGGHS